MEYNEVREKKDVYQRNTHTESEREGRGRERMRGESSRRGMKRTRIGRDNKR